MLQLPSLEMGSGLQQLSKNNPVDLWCGIGKRYKTCSHLLAVSSHASLERRSTFTSCSLQPLPGPCAHSQHVLTASSWCRAHSFSLASQNMQSVSLAFIPLMLECIGGRASVSYKHSEQLLLAAEPRCGVTKFAKCTLG